MSETVVVLKSKDRAPDFAKEMEALGLHFTQVKGLPRFFIVPGVTPEEFPLKGHPDIDNLDDGETELEPAAVQQVTVPADNLGDGGWCAARVIRRKSPWRPPNNRLPAESTFECLRTGQGVDVFMVDSGADWQHPEFGGRCIQSFFTSTSWDIDTDDSAHGTHCLALAGGKTVGIARDCRMISLKFHNANSGSGVSAAISAYGGAMEIYGANVAADRPAVLFHSWSGYTSSIDSAVSDMIDAGIVCCFPAGNNMTDLGSINQRPAESDPDGIICAGSNIRDLPYNTHNGSGTNYGVEVDIVAGAQWVQSARRSQDGGGYRTGNGTSYATSLVAGVIACMLQGYKRLTSREEVRAVKAKLIANATRGELRRGYVPGAATTPGDDPEEEGVEHLLPDRLLYLDPRVPFELIEGLTPKEA